jgi:hypothetical protein
MLTDEQIRKFCGDDEDRSELCNPFNIDEFTYATDGRFAIRIDRRNEYDSFEGPQSVKKLIAHDAIIPEDKWMLIPDVEKLIKWEQCDTCAGTGKIYTCPDCHGDGNVHFTSDSGYDYDPECKNCDGNGVVAGDNKKYPSRECRACLGTGKTVPPRQGIGLGKKYINPMLLKMIAELPNPLIAPDANPELSKAIPFKFDGGIGILMPMRKPVTYGL